MTSKATIEQHLLTLINRQIDGDLDRAESEHLQSLIDGSKELKEYRDQMLKINSALADLPTLDTPASLKQLVLKNLQKSDQSADKTTANKNTRAHAIETESKTTDWLASLLQNYWQPGGVAIAVAATLAVGLQQFGGHKFGAQDTGVLVGSLIPSKTTTTNIDSVRPLDKQQISVKGLHAELKLTLNDSLLELDFQLDQSSADTLKLEIVTGDFELQGFEENSKLGRPTELDANAITIKNNGSQLYRFVLSSINQQELTNSKPFSYQILADKKLIYKGKLNTHEKSNN